MSNLPLKMVIGLFIQLLMLLYFQFMTPSRISSQWYLPGLCILVPPCNQICSIFIIHGYDLWFILFILMFWKQTLLPFIKLVVSYRVLYSTHLLYLLLIYFWHLKICAHIICLTFLCASLCTPPCCCCCCCCCLWQKLLNCRCIKLINWDTCCAHLRWRYLWVDFWPFLRHCRCRTILSCHSHVITKEDMSELWIFPLSCIWWEHSKERCLQQQGFDTIKSPLYDHVGMKKCQRMRVYTWCLCAVHNPPV